jgi:hypothetical protein
MTTIVTAYFKLEQSKASHDIYIDRMKNMLIIDNPMVIFCETECVEWIKELRKDKIEKTNIITTTFKDFYSYQYIDTFLENYTKDHEKKVGHNIFLYLIWNEKSHFLKRAIELDPFKTDYFLWVDIGCFRRTNVDFIHWPNPIRIKQIPKDKLLLLQVIPFSEKELTCKKKEELPSFQYTNRIGAPIFGGGKEIILKWHDLYYNMLEYFISIDRFIGKDQSIMNSLYLLHQDQCELVSWKPGCDDPWFYLQDYLQ